MNLFKHRWLWLQVVVASFYYSIINLLGNDIFVHRVDDSFYYFTVARNLATTGQWSFDGVNVTSGVQPLWTAVLAGFAWVYDWVGGDVYAMTLVRSFLMLAACLHIISAIQLYFLAQDYFPRKRALPWIMSGLWLFTPGLIYNQLSGMEAALYSIVILAVLRHLKHLKPTPRSYFTLGIWLGVLCLTRLDAALWVLMLGGLLLWWNRRQEQRPGAVRRLLAVAVGGLLIVSPYLVWFYLTHDHLSPVSADVKIYYTSSIRESKGGAFSLSYWVYLARSAVETLARLLFNGVYSLFSQSFWHYVLYYRKVTTKLAVTAVASALMAIVFVPLVVSKRKTWIKKWRSINWAEPRVQILAVFALFMLLHFGFMLVGNTAYVTYSGVRWYFVPHYLGLVCIAAWLWHWLLSRPRWRILVRIVVLVVVLNSALYVILLIDPAPPHTGAWGAHQMALESNNILPAGSRIGSFNAGVVGFYSRNHVFNLDGLANNHEFFLHYLKQRNLCAYLEKYEIDYVLEYITGSLEGEMLAYRVGADPFSAHVLKTILLDYPLNETYYLVQRGECLRY